MTKPRPRGEWERALRSAAGLPKGIKATGLMLATFAKDDGTSVRPGHDQLARFLDCSKRYVAMNLADLVALGWITKVSTGSIAGVRGAANVYRLTIPTFYLAWQKDDEEWKQVSRGRSTRGTQPPETGFTTHVKQVSQTPGTLVPPIEEVLKGKSDSSASLRSAAADAAGADPHDAERWLRVIEGAA